MQFTRKLLAVVIVFVLLIVALGVAAISGVFTKDLDAILDTEDLSGGVAATVGEVEIGENAITAYIATFREYMGLEDDDDWGTWLVEEGYESVADIRSEAVSYYVNLELVRQIAADLDVDVEDSAVDDAVNEIKDQFESTEAWKEALKNQGTTEDMYWELQRLALLQDAITDQLNANIEVTDDELLEYLADYMYNLDGAKRSRCILFDSEDEDTAQSVLSQLLAGTLDFEDAVAEYSITNSYADETGDCGCDCSGVFTDTYQTALNELGVGDMSGVVSTVEGIFIIECTEVFNAPNELTSLDQIPETLAEDVRSSIDTSEKAQNYSDYVTEYKATVEVAINEMPEGLPYDLDLTPYLEAYEAALAEEAAAESDEA